MNKNDVDANMRVLGTDNTGASTDDNVEFTRRSLVKAGWVLPAVIVVGMPRNASAGFELTNGGFGRLTSAAFTKAGPIA